MVWKLYVYANYGLKAAILPEMWRSNYQLHWCQTHTTDLTTCKTAPDSQTFQTVSADVHVRRNMPAAAFASNETLLEQYQCASLPGYIQSCSESNNIISTHRILLTMGYRA